MLNKVLIIDDDNFIINAVSSSIQEEVETVIVPASTYEDAKLLIESDDMFAVAIVDLNLPDARDGDAVLLTIEKQIPTIILTGMVNESLRSLQLNESVIEYVLKSDPNSIPFLVKIVKKLINNLDATVLIVDDSELERIVLRSHLSLINIHHILVADDGENAWNVLQENPQVDMVITDYEMPNMNGLELVEKIRQKYHKDSLSIIALSATEKKSLAVDFLQMGVNDFVSKPLNVKEFHTRVNNNLEIHWLFKENQQHKKKLMELAFTDTLTKLNNRTKHVLNLKHYCKQYEKKPYVPNKPGLYLMHFQIESMATILMNSGYAKSDEIIASVADIVKPLIGKKDSFSRIQFAEFAIIFPSNTFENVQAKAKEIIKELKNNALSAEVTMSIGIAKFNPKDGMKHLIYNVSKALLNANSSASKKIQAM